MGEGLHRVHVSSNVSGMSLVRTHCNSVCGRLIGCGVVSIEFLCCEFHCILNGRVVGFLCTMVKGVIDLIHGRDDSRNASGIAREINCGLFVLLHYSNQFLAVIRQHNDTCQKNLNKILQYPPLIVV
jgi:hypothetical protein